jgi:hypothetical protein
MQLLPCELQKCDPQIGDTEQVRKEQGAASSDIQPMKSIQRDGESEEKVLLLRVVGFLDSFDESSRV